MNNADVTKLSNELIYQRYLMNNGQMRHYFKELNMPEYIALHIIAEASTEDPDGVGRTYLRDLADKMQFSIRQASKIVGKLRDKGLLTWAHDGNGDDGTYVTLTDSGTSQMENQEKVLKDYYGRVIEKYGRENMIQLLQMMKQLETVMHSELEETEAMLDDDGPTE